MTRGKTGLDGKVQRRGYFAGLCLQGVVLGSLMVFALSELWAQAHDVRLFRYQNF